MPPQALFTDRQDAGRALARELGARHDLGPAPVVLALTRGGVAVAVEVAQALHAALDICVVRKLGLPGHAEWAMGAIASGGVRVMNPWPGLEFTPEAIGRVLAQEEAELARRERVYRGPHPAIAIAGRRVILVDDGMATGASMRAAAVAVRQQHPLRLMVAVPVAAREACAALGDVADEVLCLATPQPFRAVSLWYRHMPQLTDEEVQGLLEKARHAHAQELRAEADRPPGPASAPGDSGGQAQP